MKVLEYLNRHWLYTKPVTSEEGFRLRLEELKFSLGVKYTINDEYPDLVVLNYCQIDSPKRDEITKECRSLVLSMNEQSGEFEISSRSFDRFFNHEEIAEDSSDINTLVAHEKIDGSLIGLWYTKKYGWLYRTRSMIMPTSSVNGWDMTWKELLEGSLYTALEFLSVPGKGYGGFYDGCTYIFEVVSPENRIVTRYPKREVYLLAARWNDELGGYLPHNSLYEVARHCFECKMPKTYSFDTFHHCAEAAKELRELQEGYVLYDKETGEPKLKLKNPAYVAAHHLRGEGLNPKRMMQLILMGEDAEYLTIFPEDEDKFKPYQKASYELKSHIASSFTSYSDITDQKEFALKIKDKAYSAILFQARARKEDPLVVWNNQKESYKIKVLESFVK